MFIRCDKGGGCSLEDPCIERVRAAQCKYDEAFWVFHEALLCEQQQNDDSLLARINLRVGRIAVERNDYLTAHQLAQKGLITARLSADVLGRSKPWFCSVLD